MILQEATTVLQANTTRLHLATLQPGATTPLQATQQELMTRLELTHPHRMSRHPHMVNPRPSAMITLTTHQSPLIDRHTFLTEDLC